MTYYQGCTKIGKQTWCLSGLKLWKCEIVGGRPNELWVLGADF